MFIQHYNYHTTISVFLGLVLYDLSAPESSCLDISESRKPSFLGELPFLSFWARVTVLIIMMSTDGPESSKNKLILQKEFFYFSGT